MPDKVGGHAARAIPFLLKREDAEPPHKPPAHQVRTPRPPRPELRANEIDVLHALALQRARKTQVKPGEISENCEAWFSPLRLFHQQIPDAFECQHFIRHYDD